VKQCLHVQDNFQRGTVRKKKKNTVGLTGWLLTQISHTDIVTAPRPGSLSVEVRHTLLRGDKATINLDISQPMWLLQPRPLVKSSRKEGHCGNVLAAIRA